MSASPASTSTLAAGGRAAAMERRRALSAGKAALPPATERVRNGERSAGVPHAATAAPVAAAPVATISSIAPKVRPTAPAPAPGSERAVVATPGISGRLLSMQRRRLLAAGKQALPKSAPPASPVPPTGAAPGPAAAPAALQEVVPCAKGATCAEESCRAQARARRAMLSVRGRGSAPAAAPSRPPREGRLQYAPKVVESVTHGRQTVTGLRIGLGSKVTGVESGASLPVSGTQYIGTDGGAPVRGGGPKVGHARTFNGGIVSGTLVRSRVPITGDEAGNTVITGEAEQRPEDDLTQRAGDGALTSAQFQRQVDPHGHSVFGINLGRSAGSVGSRERRREVALESTEAGLAITGSAVGRTSRVTGDDDGACRHVTGDQYLSPARAQTECGGSGGGTAPAVKQGPAMNPGATRRDPVTGAKVRVSATWGRQRVTGPDVEHNPRVTGDAPGSCQLITGTPYQGPNTVQSWCDPATGEAAEQLLTPRPASAAVTGDAPAHDESVTGTGRGAARSVTGTPYYRDTGAAATARPDPIAAQEAGFSVRSPQRMAHLRSERAAAAKNGTATDAPGGPNRITGAFAVGDGKITGNLEFLFKPRQAQDPETKPAHARISGEGRTVGQLISGDSWADRKNVTGTDGFTAVDRNPSERQGKPHAFAGALRFKSLAANEEPKQLVTGMFGWSSNSAAKVTLSGGAHG
jgi:hypothetical protein